MATKQSENTGSSLDQMALRVILNLGMLRRFTIGCFAAIIVVICLNHRRFEDESAWLPKQHSNPCEKSVEKAQQVK